jgi:hypothetical protein
LNDSDVIDFTTGSALLMAGALNDCSIHIHGEEYPKRDVVLLIPLPLPNYWHDSFLGRGLVRIVVISVQYRWVSWCNFTYLSNS